MESLPSMHVVDKKVLYEWLKINCKADGFERGYFSMYSSRVNINSATHCLKIFYSKKMFIFPLKELDNE